LAISVVGVHGLSTWRSQQAKATNNGKLAQHLSAWRMTAPPRHFMVYYAAILCGYFAGEN
jgi:hypothetical protein